MLISNLRIFFLAVLTAFLVSCGNGDDDNQNQDQGSTIERSSTELGENSYKLIEEQKLSVDKKNKIIGAVNTAIKLHKKDKTARENAINKAVKDNGGSDALASELNTKVAEENPIAAETVKLDDQGSLSNATYKLFKDICDANADKCQKLNDILAQVIEINDQETVANGSTQVTRNTKIDNLNIVPADLAEGDVAQFKGRLKTTMQAHVGLLSGVIELTKVADSGLNPDIYNKIIEQPLRGARSAQQLNEIIVAVRDAITANSQPKPARNTAIENAVAAQGGANAAYSDAIKTIVDQKHQENITAEAASGLKTATYTAVVTTANTSLNNTQRNALMAAVVVAKDKGTSTERNTEIENAIKAVRGIAPGTALAGEDTTLATAIKAAVAADYPIEVTTQAKSGLAQSVWDVINASGRTAEQKNAIISAVVAAKNLAEAQRRTQISQAVTRNGGTDATLANNIITAVTDAYDPAGMLGLDTSGLDAVIYWAIRNAAIDNAHKVTLIGADNAPGTLHPIRGAMDTRPRDKRTRDAAILAAVDGLRIVDATQVLNLKTSLLAAADAAQAIDALTSEAGSGLAAGIYNAIVGTGDPANFPRSISNAQMNAVMAPVDNALKVRPLTQDNRDNALKAAVRTVLGLDAAAELSATNNVDAFNWYTLIKTAVDTAHAITALDAKPNDMAQAIYDAIVGQAGITNAEMNQAIRSNDLKNAIKDNRGDKPARDTAIKAALSGAGVLGRALTGDTLLWADAIIAAADTTYADAVIAKNAAALNSLNEDVYNLVIGMPGKSNAEINNALVVLASLLDPATITHQNRVEAIITDAAGNFSGLSADGKRNLLRAMDQHHPLTVAAGPDVSKGVVEKNMVVGGTPGLVVRVDETNNDLIKPFKIFGVTKKKRVFLPSAMLAELHVKVGDEVWFTTISPAGTMINIGQADAVNATGNVPLITAPITHYVIHP
ncbi:MAG: hypothetical protein KC505_02390 [Myxococcales bacterium]|nr:hypothetical protein [Myxococcales bacterium]USN51762.1 MAG: hypothetical protein H6731_04970 [Myxococcales bacterium]